MSFLNVTKIGLNNNSIPNTSITIPKESKAALSSFGVSHRAGQMRLRAENMKGSTIKDSLDYLLGILGKYGNNSDGILAILYAANSEILMQFSF